MEAVLLPFATLGLAGGLHCVGMCGPIALALPGLGASTSSSIFLWHLGRTISYSILGLGAGFIGEVLRPTQVLDLICLLTGFALILMYFFPRKFRGLSAPLWLERTLTRLRSLWQRNLKSREGTSFFLLGSMQILLPCGLLYGAVLMAAATNDSLHGALGMCVFALCSKPLLLLMTLGLGKKASQVKVLNQAGLLILACWLILRAMGLYGHPVHPIDESGLICVPLPAQG